MFMNTSVDDYKQENIKFKMFYQAVLDDRYVESYVSLEMRNNAEKIIY